MEEKVEKNKLKESCKALKDEELKGQTPVRVLNASIVVFMRLWLWLELWK